MDIVLLITLACKAKCFKSLIFWVFLFISSSGNRVCISALQAQFPVLQFTIQISLQDGGHSMTYFQSQTISLFVNELYRVFCGFCIYPTFFVQRLWKCDILVIAEFFEFYTPAFSAFMDNVCICE